MGQITATWGEPANRPTGRIRIVAWEEEPGGVESTSDYAEIYWLPVIGPSSLFMHRRLTRMVGQETTSGFLADAIGIGWRQTETRNGPYGRTMGRLEQFGWIRRQQAGDDLIIHVRTRLRHLEARDLRKLPRALIADHEREVQPMG